MTISKSLSICKAPWRGQWANCMLYMLLLCSQPRPCHCLKLLLLRNPASVHMLASLLCPSHYICFLGASSLQDLNCSSLMAFLACNLTRPGIHSQSLRQLFIKNSQLPGFSYALALWFISLCWSDSLQALLLYNGEAYITLPSGDGSSQRAGFWHHLRFPVLPCRSFIFPGVSLSYSPLLAVSDLPSPLSIIPTPFNHW